MNLHISDHAIERFQVRVTRKVYPRFLIESKIKNLIKSASEVKPRGLKVNKGERYFMAAGFVMVVKNDCVMTILIANKDRWERID